MNKYKYNKYKIKYHNLKQQTIKNKLISSVSTKVGSVDEEYITLDDNPLEMQTGQKVLRATLAGRRA